MKSAEEFLKEALRTPFYDNEIEQMKDNNETRWHYTLKAMESYAQYKVNELNKSDVIKSACDHNYPAVNGWNIYQPQHCSNCGEDL